MSNVRYWKANSYSPLKFDLPDRNGLRGQVRGEVTLLV